MTDKLGRFRRHALGRLALAALVGAFILCCGAASTAAGPIVVAQYVTGATSLDSFSTDGGAGNANNGPCATGMSDHCGDKSGNTGTATNDPCATGMSDHCGDKTGNPGTADNNPCVTDMSDHCGNKDDGHTVAATNAPVSAATLLTPSSNGAFSPSQPVGDAVRKPATTPALGPPLVIVPNR